MAGGCRGAEGGGRSPHTSLDYFPTEFRSQENENPEGLPTSSLRLFPLFPRTLEGDRAAGGTVALDVAPAKWTDKKCQGESSAGASWGVAVLRNQKPFKRCGFKSCATLYVTLERHQECVFARPSLRWARSTSDPEAIRSPGQRTPSCDDQARDPRRKETKGRAGWTSGDISLPNITRTSARV